MCSPASPNDGKPISAYKFKCGTARILAADVRNKLEIVENWRFFAEYCQENRPIEGPITCIHLISRCHFNYIAPESKHAERQCWESFESGVTKILTPDRIIQASVRRQ